MLLRLRREDPVAVTLQGAGLPVEAARRLSQAGTLLHIKAGTELCTLGELGAEAFVLVEGEAVVHLPDRDIVVEPGAVIGEIAALDPHVRRTATVVTTTPCSVLAYDVRTFRSLAASDLHDVLVPARAA
jgi:CRP-like cAMP-binding protein